MALNVEIKARIDEPDLMEARIEAVAGAPVAVMRQEDVFFFIQRGRIKLRILAPDHGELIFYDRLDELGPTPSHYHVAPTAEPEALRVTLAEALGIRGVVRKTRKLFQLGQTRIHLDQVDGLGSFLELEVVLEPGESVADGTRIAQALLEQFGLDEGSLVKGAYIDLLERRVI
jgi:predicted adenylyl cyclase CyaB